MKSERMHMNIAPYNNSFWNFLKHQLQHEGKHEIQQLNRFMGISEYENKYLLIKA